MQRESRDHIGQDFQDATELMARQAISCPGGRDLVARAVCQFFRQGPKRGLVRDIGASIYQLAGPKTLRAVADAVASSDDEVGLLAHDELLSGFWRI